MDVAYVMDGGNITLELNDSLSPCLIKEEGNDSYNASCADAGVNVLFHTDE